MARLSGKNDRSNGSQGTPIGAIDVQTRGSGNALRILVAGLLCLLIGIAFLNRDWFSLTTLAERESQLEELQQMRPVLVYGAAFLAYVLMTGFSLPGAALMTLLMGWYFGFVRGVVLVSFASTAGATMAFLLSRYLFRNAVRSKFGDRLKSFNESLEREGAFYLFSLRLIPAVPFFVINVVMGLTPIRTLAFWWVSQVGMLAGTAVYCYAGSKVPDLQMLVHKGATAAFSPSQLTQITLAFTLLGVFPIAVKALMSRLSRRRTRPAAT